MTAIPTNTLLQSASRYHYAVAAVNIVDDLSLRAAVHAAELLRSPLVIQTSVKTVRSLGADALWASFSRTASLASVPISLHLDHCPDRSVISECLALGWSSVLFDASNRALDAAVQETADVVREAHAVGASVEAEIENIAGVEDSIGSDLEGSRYSIETLVDFVRATDCDFFAPALGTAHGLYSARPDIDPGRAADLRGALGIPLVLHGGTGLTRAEFQEFIEAGCSKINLSTTLKRAYMKAALHELRDAEQRDEWDPPVLFSAIGDAVTADISRYIEVFGSGGKA